MERLRKFRRPVALLLGLFMLLGAGLGDAAIAAHGPQLQFPLCTPGGADNPVETPERLNLSDHCDFCPLGTGFGGLTLPLERQVFTAASMTAAEPGYQPFLTIRRAELTPLEGRAPPFQS